MRIFLIMQVWKERNAEQFFPDSAGYTKGNTGRDNCSASLQTSSSRSCGERKSCISDIRLRKILTTTFVTCGKNTVFREANTVWERERMQALTH